MSRPLYAVLRAAFPLKSKVSTAQLYESIGHPEYGPDTRMQNTCAVRLSVALAGAGIAIHPGNITVLAGSRKGWRLESGQARLSNFLLRRWGDPERYRSGPEARKVIGARRGVVSFYHLYGAMDQQGHIDLIAPDEWHEAACADDCYWQSTEVWFWPLK
jgi:hypothetical protein